MPINSSESFGKDPTVYRWREGIWATIFDNLVSVLILSMIIVPLSNFGTISSQKNIIDESMNTFEIDFVQELSSMRLDVSISHSTWDKLKSELGP